MTTQEWFTFGLVCGGAVLMCVAILMTRNLIPFVSKSTFRSHWRILKWLMFFFLAGYLGVSALVLAGHLDLIALLAGVIFLFGALFVLLVVHTSFLTIRELHSTTVSREELEEANVKLEELSRSKSSFLSAMSHELRTPLNAIMGYSQLLEIDNNNLNESQRDRIAHILEASKHLLVLINEVLDFSRIESGTMEFNCEPLDLHQLLREITTLLAPLSDERKIRIEIHDSCSTFVIADRMRLKQVLINLLSNAIKYNRESGWVTIDCQRQQAEMTRLSIRDSGTGIPKDKLSTIFAPFERLEFHKNVVEGTGIGLALVEELTISMMGKVGAESVEGEGSCFWVELPSANAA